MIDNQAILISNNQTDNNNQTALEVENNTGILPYHPVTQKRKRGL
jgi:hypothetical protein